ncbi:MAG TPA: rRNA maturation RNase YbeY [Chitinophagales bacterium]|nr:rRNA maturation RNase YbeY [Chitinophagales bacterium]
MPVSFHYQVPSFKIKNKYRIIDWILLIAFLQKKVIEKVDFIFCNDEFLLKLNKEFLAHKAYTDVITFNYSEANNIIAEIYISIDRVRENAISFSEGILTDKFSFDKELSRVMIHGVLHCFGYTDKNDRDKKMMRRKEEECLRLLEEMKKN